MALPCLAICLPAVRVRSTERVQYHCQLLNLVTPIRTIHVMRPVRGRCLSPGRVTCREEVDAPQHRSREGCHVSRYLHIRARPRYIRLLPVLQRMHGPARPPQVQIGKPKRLNSGLHQS
jgi:hypothetical protein